MSQLLCFTILVYASALSNLPISNDLIRSSNI